MTWTYSDSEASSKDVVRGRIGDVNEKDPILSDEVISAVLAQYPSTTLASAKCCERVLARISRHSDRSAIGITSSRSQAVQHYQDLLRELRREVASEAEMFVGGQSRSATETLRANTDTVPSPFRVGQDDIPGGPSYP